MEEWKLDILDMICEFLDYQAENKLDEYYEICEKRRRKMK